jgi:hypothetical protein
MNQCMIDLIRQSSSSKSLLNLIYTSSFFFNDLYYGKLSLKVKYKRKKREKKVIIDGIPRLFIIFFKDGHPEKITFLDNHYTGTTYSFFNDGNKASIIQFKRKNWEETLFFSSLDGKDSVVKSTNRCIDGNVVNIYRAPIEKKTTKTRARRRYFGH